MVSDNIEFTDDEFAENERKSFGEQIDLQFYLRILRKYKWPITLFTALMTVLAAYYAYTATPIYRSTSTLLIESQKANVVSFESFVGAEKENSDYYQTQFELLKSRELAKRVIAKLELADSPLFNPSIQPGPGADLNSGAAAASSDISGSTAEDNAATSSTDSKAGILAKLQGLLNKVTGVEPVEIPDEALLQEGSTAQLISTDLESSEQSESSDQMQAYGLPESTNESIREQQLVNRFMANLTVEPVRKTKLVKISYDSPDPDFAALVANTVGEQYIISYLDAKMELSTQATEWMQERIGTLKSQLEDSKSRLQDYKVENGLIDVNGSVGRLNEQELLLITTELAQAKSQLSDAADLRREVRSLGGNNQLLETLPSIQNDALVRSVKIEQGQRQRELDELLNRYGSKHPKVRDAVSRLESLDLTLSQHISRVVSTIEKDYKLLASRVSSIQGTLLTGKQEIQEIGSKKFELDALEREVVTNQEVYDTYFNRMTEASSADGLEAANARISDYAVPSLGAIKPKKQLIIALAALGSLILSCLMAFLYEQMDDTVKTTSDIEEKVKAKLLGVLPLVKGGLFGGKQQLPLTPGAVGEKNGTFFEAVNTVRTAISLEDRNRKQKVILITSSVPGEGKSTTSINLAYSLAQLEKVLLIDCDLRKPSIAKSLELPKGSAGLSDLITKSAEPKACIIRNAIGDLDVIPAGSPVDHPLELLSSPRFEKIIDLLSNHYDRIVLDSAPTQAVSDSLVLSRISDSVVYAAKSHSTPIEMIKRGLQRLRQVQAPIAGVVITQVDVKRIASYGGDYYYQGYYDYYGYHDKATQSAGRLDISQKDLQEIQSGSEEPDFDFGFEPAINGETCAMDQIKAGTVKGTVNASRSNGGNSNGANGYHRNLQNGHAHNSHANNGQQAANGTDKSRFDEDLDLDHTAAIVGTNDTGAVANGKSRKLFEDDLDLV